MRPNASVVLRHGGETAAMCLHESSTIVQPATPSFRSLYEAEFAYVYTSLRRMGVKSRHIEDLTHDVFMIVHRKLDDYDPSRPLRPWLFGIAYRVALDHRRRASTTREIPDEHIEGGLAEESDGRTARRAQAREIVMEALEHVALERRSVFILYEIDGHPMPAIAEALDLPVHTAYARLRKAREEFTEAARALREPPCHDAGEVAG